MNKYQEALEHIIKCDREDCGMSYLSDAYRNDLSVLRELVDKATPKKPINKATYNYDDIPFTALCPNCKENLGYESKNIIKYCYKCGQALDWSDTNARKECLESFCDSFI